LHANSTGQLVTEEDVKESWSIGGAAFLNTDYTGVSSSPQVNLSSTGLAAGSASTNNTIYASVQLPQGADLKKMIVYFVDSGDPDDLVVEFKYCELTGTNGCTTIASYQSDFFTPFPEASPPIALNHVVDNTKYTYFISATNSSGDWYYNSGSG